MATHVEEFEVLALVDAGKVLVLAAQCEQHADLPVGGQVESYGLRQTFSPTCRFQEICSNTSPDVSYSQVFSCLSFSFIPRSLI